MKYSIILFIFCFSIIILSITPVRCQNTLRDIDKLINQYEHAVKGDNQKDAALLSNKIGFSLWRNGELNSSIKYFKEAAKLNDDLNNFKSLQGNYTSIGLVYSELKDFNEAIKNYQKALKIAKDQQDKKSIANTLINIGSSYNSISKTKRAINYVEEALPLALALDNNELKETCYRLLADFNSKSGNIDKAKEYMNNYTLLIQAKENEQIARQRANQMQQIEGQLYDAEVESEAAKTALLSQADKLSKTQQTLKEMEKLAIQKQLQVNLLNTEQELKNMTITAQEANLKSSRIMRNSFIVGFVLVSSLIVVILFDVKKKKDANQKIHLQHLNITSSINYAQRIQHAMLPKNEEVDGFMDTNAFILFRPRDVVSGDFYWFKRIPGSNDLVIAAVDCTGHGVPGAFMSMVGMNALNGIVARGIKEVNTILDALHKEVRDSLSQEETGNNDGMDMALCIIREKEKKIEFAGAKNPMIYIQNGEINQIKGDVHPIGGGKYSKEKPFNKHVVDITSDTMVYLFSDGYKDQFGGPDNMKFMAKKFKSLLSDIHQLSLEMQKKRLNDSLEKWMGTGQQIDDVLVIGFKVEA